MENEIDEDEVITTQFYKGETVDIMSADGKVLFADKVVQYSVPGFPYRVKLEDGEVFHQKGNFYVGHEFADETMWLRLSKRRPRKQYKALPVVPTQDAHVEIVRTEFIVWLEKKCKIL